MEGPRHLLVMRFSSMGDVAMTVPVVKAVLAKDKSALYFSRSEIPYIRDACKSFPVYKHLGIYGYRKDTIKKIVSLETDLLKSKPSEKNLIPMGL